MQKKTKKITILILLAAVLLAVITYVTCTDRKNDVCHIDSSIYVSSVNPVVVSNNILWLSGCKKNGSIMYVFVDDRRCGVALSEGGVWKYRVDLKALGSGWHYYYFSETAVPMRATGKGFFVNKPQRGPVAVVPEKVVIDARNENNNIKRQYKSFGVDGLTYDPKGVYWGNSRREIVPDKVIRFDKNNIPMILYNNDTWCYNTTTISQFALGWYSPELINKKTSSDYINFIKYSNWIVDNQKSDGSYRYETVLNYRDDVLSKGWVSGMAQGQVLSVMARAYYLTGDMKYIKCGEKCLDFMVKPCGASHRDGCRDTISDFTRLDDSLSKYKNCNLYEEMLTEPRSHILNGDLFALVGLHDWSVMCPDRSSADKAEKAFASGAEAIEVLLPYYDFYGYSAYDIMQYTGNYTPRFKSIYAHSCHVVLLKAMYDITGDKEFYEYYLRFKNYSDDPFYRQTADMYRAGN